MFRCFDPDGYGTAGVRQDTVLLVAPDTVRQHKVSGGIDINQECWCPVKDTDLPSRIRPHPVCVDDGFPPTGCEPMQMIG